MTTARGIVRTRGGGKSSPLDLVPAPVGLLLFEGPHFIMQPRMLLGMKTLAENVEDG